MTDHMIHALLALLDGPTNGYDMLRRMRKRGHKIETGTLYGSVIPRLEKRGYITISDVDSFKWEITLDGINAITKTMLNSALTAERIESALRQYDTGSTTRA